MLRTGGSTRVSAHIVNDQLLVRDIVRVYIGRFAPWCFFSHRKWFAHLKMDFPVINTALIQSYDSMQSVR
jgi:hypothetical protein